MIFGLVGAGVFVLGACLGSFAVASVWRLRARQLATDRAAKRRYDKREYARLKPLLGQSVADDRSRCLHCGHKLSALELVPIVSWLVLRGRCSKCKKPIGLTELLAELLLGAAFLASFLRLAPYLTPLSVIHLVVWLCFLVILAMLLIYDLKWSVLPSSLLYGAVGVALAILGLDTLQLDPQAHLLVSLAISLALLPGLYYLLYKVSGGRWVGDGDWLLALALALVLQDYALSLLTLFASNLIGCLVFALNRALGSKNLSVSSRVPFGPMLIAGFFVVWLLQGPILRLLMI